jgi:hypothetical protein
VINRIEGRCIIQRRWLTAKSGSSQLIALWIVWHKYYGIRGRSSLWIGRWTCNARNSMRPWSRTDYSMSRGDQDEIKRIGDHTKITITWIVGDARSLPNCSNGLWLNERKCKWNGNDNVWVWWKLSLWGCEVTINVCRENNGQECRENSRS